MESFGPARKRACLKCGKTFASEGPANRICPTCNAENAKHSNPRVEIIKPERKERPHHD